MKNIFKKLTATIIALSCLFSFGYAKETAKDPITGVSFPTEVQADNEGKNTKLDLTGIATRQKFIVKVYSLAHYMESPEKVSTAKEAIDEILNDNSRVKQFTIHWVRGVEADKIKESYETAINKTLSKEQIAKLQTEVDAFLNAFKKGSVSGDIYEIRWFPNGLLTMDENGKRLTEINSPEFAKAVWEIWLGEHSVVKRDKLVSNLVDSKE